MKKSVLALSFIALFSLASKAQEVKNNKKEQVKEGEAAKTSSDPAAALKQEGQPKKSGTRMAINEKGLPGNAKTEKKEAPKEEKAVAPGQPNSATKKDK
jgi:hypothetical protein